MSFREITQLRKEGHLQEALEMATRDLEARRDEWSLRAIFWVYRDLCNLYISQGNLQQAHECMQQAERLYEEMGEDEIADKALRHLRKATCLHYQDIKDMASLSKEGKTKEAYQQVRSWNIDGSLEKNLHEEYGWIIFRYLKQHFAELGSLESRKILFEYIKLSNPRPSLLHSQMLALASQISEKYPDLKFLPFLKLWGTGTFREEDFHESINDGVNYAPLITRIIDRCFKMDYRFRDIAEVFSNVSQVTEERIAVLCSRHYFFEILKRRNDPKGTLTTLIERYLDETEHIGIPNPFHSKVLQTVCWRQKSHQDINFKKFFERWGMSLLMKDDWTRTPSEKGDLLFPSLAEKAIKYYKESLEGNGGLKEAADDFRLLIETAIAMYPGDSQYLRLYGQYLISHGEQEKAIDTYKKLLPMLNKFYVWDELAQILDNRQLKFSAWCKALSSGEKEEFVGKIHLCLAEFLTEEKHFEEAEHELRKVNKTYKKNGWKLPGSYYVTEKSVQTAGTGKTKALDYSSHTQEIEEFVYGNLEYVQMCVTSIFKDKNKTKIRLCDGKGQAFIVNPRPFPAITHARRGQVVNVRIADGKVQMLRESDKKDWSIFEEKYGVVDYVNLKKSVYHILDTDSTLIYHHFRQQQFTKGDMVVFRVYRDTYKGKEILSVGCIKKVDTKTSH